MPISWLDVILIAIMLISGFLAMVRGFTDGERGCEIGGID